MASSKFIIASGLALAAFFTGNDAHAQGLFQRAGNFFRQAGNEVRNEAVFRGVNQFVNESSRPVFMGVRKSTIGGVVQSGLRSGLSAIGRNAAQGTGQFAGMNPANLRLSNGATPRNPAQFRLSPGATPGHQARPIPRQ